MKGGYAGKLLFVNLTTGTVEEKVLSEELAMRFIGGYGIGARLLFDMVRPNVDPLGPENVLGFCTGLLNATGALYGGRYMVVCKSPVTGGWNDANSGGFFGPELKRAGFDAVFVSGASRMPVYIFIKDGKAEIRDARALWGKDCTETQKALVDETGEPKLRAAVIGPAGEKQSLMACVINDEHRAAGRGGCGAVMGSKNLKAVAVRGTLKIAVAEPEKVKLVNQEIRDFMKNGPTSQMLEGFGVFGTGEGTGAFGLIGDSPVKNWAGVGALDMGDASLMSMSTSSYDAKYKTKKYACANCPLGCGARYKVEEGKWPVGETDRPEYETIAAFGTMTLNKDVESIIKCNDICNRYGLDTISTGATVAWAIECYERGLISKEETQGIELTWGNGASVVAMTQAIADQTGFGKILALGSAKAAEKLARGAEYLQSVRGIELPMHDPRFGPGYARTYQCDPTPGRHTKGGLGLQQLMQPPSVKYSYTGKGRIDVEATCHFEVVSSAGLCSFGVGMGMPPDAVAKLIAAVTGWDFSQQDVIKTGQRIMNMRYAFNLREGQKPTHDIVPKRPVGEPPLSEGPLKDVSVDYRKLADEFFENIGWDKQTLLPTRESLEQIGGMDDVIKDLYG